MSSPLHSEGIGAAAVSMPSPYEAHDSSREHIKVHEYLGKWSLSSHVCTHIGATPPLALLSSVAEGFYAALINDVRFPATFHLSHIPATAKETYKWCWYHLSSPHLRNNTQLAIRVPLNRKTLSFVLMADGESSSKRQCMHRTILPPEI